MKSPLKCVTAALLALFELALPAASVHAQSTFVYTNDYVRGPNTVSVFTVGAGGTLGPPTTFLTGGTAGAPGFTASHRITTATTSTGDFLYASNGAANLASPASNDISAFSINPTSGLLTLVGPPVGTGASGPNDISLAATPNGQFLYSGNSSFSGTVSGFAIGPTGALTLLPGFPIPVSGAPDGMTVSPDGKFLAVALSLANTVAMFSIGPTGALTPVPGSPFPGGSGGTNTDVVINCASNLLFTANSHPLVTVYTIASNGVLTQIAGSPFMIGGSDSNVGVLSPDDRFLFVSNQSGQTITSLNVAPGGSLTQVTGSPFSNSGATPSRIATNQAGTLLYAANLRNTVSGFSIASNGALSPVAGSPFSTGSPGNLASLTVFPAKTCGCKDDDAEGTGDEQGDEHDRRRHRHDSEDRDMDRRHSRDCGGMGEMESEGGDKEHDR
jgi:6-phosphogluconolactonase (cycloisomerase 2 family)